MVSGPASSRQEHGRLAVGGLLADKAHGLSAAHGLLQIDDVNAVAFGEMNGACAGPNGASVAEMDASFEQVFICTGAGILSLSKPPLGPPRSLISKGTEYAATACGIRINA
jgi:hypothetical protein